jgi:hypothetical protein
MKDVQDNTIGEELAIPIIVFASNTDPSINQHELSNKIEILDLNDDSKPPLKLYDLQFNLFQFLQI